MMSRLFIHVGNYVWLVIVLIGVPVITGMQVGGINVSATSKFQMLTLAGLGIGSAINLFGGWWLVGKPRRTCWKWTAIYLVIFVTFYLLFSGYIHFDWLKKALLWLKGLVS